MSSLLEPVDPMALTIPERLETPRLLLRRYQLSDAALLLEVFHDERERLKDDFPARTACHTEADVDAFILHATQQWRARAALYFGIWQRPHGSYVGEVGLKEIVWAVPKADIGYFVTSQAEGKGIAMEAVSRLVQFSFETLRMNKLQIRCTETNLRSQRVAERCRFRREGVLRNDSIRPDRQALVNLVYYGLTPEDFREHCKET